MREFVPPPSWLFLPPYATAVLGLGTAAALGLSTLFARISELSSGNREIVVNNLGHIIDIATLREMFDRLDGRKAVGIDGATKAKYGEKLERNLERRPIEVIDRI